MFESRAERSNPAPKLDCRRASRQNCANIDTPDTNWQSNVREENTRTGARSPSCAGSQEKPKGQHPEASSSRWLPKRWRA
jgi:hypothetical protein